MMVFHVIMFILVRAFGTDKPRYFNLAFYLVLKRR